MQEICSILIEYFLQYFIYLFPVVIFCSVCCTFYSGLGMDDRFLGVSLGEVGRCAVRDAMASFDFFSVSLDGVGRRDCAKDNQCDFSCADWYTDGCRGADFLRSRLDKF